MNENIKTGLKGIGLVILCIIAIAIFSAMAPFIIFIGGIFLDIIILIIAILLLIWSVGAIINLSKKTFKKRGGK